MATYYVATTGNDSNAGTIGSPFLTIKKGVSVAAPNDTVYIRGGTYAGVDNRIDSSLSTVPGGTSWSNPITIAGYPGETVTLQPAASGSDISLIKLLTGTQQYLIFQDIILDCVNLTGSPNPIYLEGGANHNRFLRIELKNNRIASGNGFGLVLGKNSGGASFIEILNSKFHDIGRVGGPQTDGHALYMSTADNLVEGNEFYNVLGYPINFYDNAGPKAVSRNIARKNKIHDNGRVGVLSYGILFAWGDANIAYDNIIWNQQGGGVQIYNGSTNAQAINNTIYNNRDQAIAAQYYENSPIARNNIAFNNGSGVVDFGGVGALIADHNLTTDPGFVNVGANDFHLQATSAAIDAGITVGSVPDDYDGVARPQGSTYDIGAYEYLAQGGGGSGGTNANTPVVTASSNARTAGAGTSLTWSHTSDSNPLYVVVEGLSGVAPSGCTFNGVAMVLQWSQNRAENVNHMFAVYSLAAPASGAHNVVVSWAGATDTTAGALNVSGGPSDASIQAPGAVGNSSSGTATGITVRAFGDNALTVAFTTSEKASQVFTPASSQTVLWSQDSLTGTNTRGACGTLPTSGATQAWYTNSVSGENVSAGFAIPNGGTPNSGGSKQPWVGRYGSQVITTPSFGSIVTPGRILDTNELNTAGWCLSNGRIRSMAIRLAAAPGGAITFTITVRKNYLDTAMTVTFGSADTLKTVSVDVNVWKGDLLGLRFDISGASGATVDFDYFFEFESADMGASTYSGQMAFSDGVGNTLNSERFKPLMFPWTGAWTTTTPGEALDVIGCDGTITEYLSEFQTDLGSGNTFTGYLYKNGVKQDGTGGTVNTQMLLTGDGRSVTSVYRKVIALPVVAGDYVSVSETLTAGSAASLRMRTACRFVATTPGLSQICGYSSSVSNSATSWLIPDSDDHTGITSAEALATIRVGALTSNFRVTGAYIKLTVAPGTSKSRVFTLRKNSAAATGSFTITITGAATTGSGASTATFAEGDTFDLQEAPASTPTSATHNWALQAQSLQLRVITLPASNLTITSARLNGQITPEGLSTNGWFIWGTDNPPTQFTTASQSIGSGYAPVSYYQDISGLVAGTTYYFQAVGNDGGGNVYGAVLSFVALSQPAYQNPCSIKGPLWWGVVKGQATTYKGGSTTVRDAATRLGGLKPPRLLSFTGWKRTASDWRTGSWQAQGATVRWADTDRAIRAGTEGAESGSMLSNQYWHFLDSDEWRQGGFNPWLVFQGQVLRDRLVGDLTWEGDMRDDIGAGYSLTRPEITVPARKAWLDFGAYGYSEAGKFTISELCVPVVAGTHSDEAAAAPLAPLGRIPIFYGGTLLCADAVTRHVGVVAGHACQGGVINAYAMGGTGAIKTSSVANPSVIETSGAHNLITGTVVVIAGHIGSTPNINGARVATVIDSTHFSVPINVTVAGSGGTFSPNRVVWGTNAWAPGQTGWATVNPSGAALYTDLTSPSDSAVRRYTLIFFTDTGGLNFAGDAKNVLANLGSNFATGAQAIHVNMHGFTVNPDGTGGEITGLHAQMLFCFQNFFGWGTNSLADPAFVWNSGPWLNTPTFEFYPGSGTLMARFDDASFATAANISALYTPGNVIFKGAFVLGVMGKAETIRSVIAKFTINGLVQFGWNVRYSQMFVTMLDRRRTVFMAAATVVNDRLNTLISAPIRVELQDELLVSQFITGWDYNYRTNAYTTIDATIGDVGTRTRFGSRPGPNEGYQCISDTVTANAVGAQRFAFLKAVRYLVKWKESICGLARELLGPVQLTHFAGRGGSGYSARGLMVQSHTINQDDTVDIEAYDVDDLLS